MADAHTRAEESADSRGCRDLQDVLGGRMALVTGASRGLGRAFAVALARAGADVAVGLRDVSRDEGVIDEIGGVGRRVIAVQMDVTNAQQVNDAVQTVVQELGALDLLVNNAGGGAGLTPAEAISPSDFQRTIDVNLTGTFVACQAAFPAMRAQGFGRIVNISSQAAIVALPGEAAYCAAKAAVSHLTRCLAVEWGKYGINVNAVAPRSSARQGRRRRSRIPRFAPT